jgi:hypothetical protein
MVSLLNWNNEFGSMTAIDGGGVSGDCLDYDVLLNINLY